MLGTYGYRVVIVIKEELTYGIRVAISTCLEGGAVGCKESTSWYVADIDTGMDTGNSRN